MSNGEEVLIRPIRPEDEPMMVEFHQQLAPDSIYLRYFHPISVGQLNSHDQLVRLCCRHCLSVFLGNPEKYIAKLEAAKRPAEPAPADAKQSEGHAH